MKEFLPESNWTQKDYHSRDLQFKTTRIPGTTRPPDRSPGKGDGKSKEKNGDTPTESPIRRQRPPKEKTEKVKRE